MSRRPTADITELIQAWNAGEPDALDRLTEAVYPELHRLALSYFRRERSSHTLQCTALVNEAYIRLIRSPDKQWKNRAHFFGFAAGLMRGILVDYARARETEKRGGPNPTLSLSETDRPRETPAAEVDILDLHRALKELESLDSFQSRVVELRYFGGLSIPETAAATGVSESTVKREWLVAKTWIRRRLLQERSEL